MDVCWGCAAETQRLCKTLGARAATGYGLVVQGDYGSDKRKKPGWGPVSVFLRVN